MRAPEICSHLNPLLGALLKQGAEIENVETGWSEANLVVTLTKGLNSNIAQIEAKARNLEFWKNDDAHYPIEYGCFCNEHKHGISWPQGSAVIDAL